MAEIVEKKFNYDSLPNNLMYEILIWIKEKDYFNYIKFYFRGEIDSLINVEKLGWVGWVLISDVHSILNLETLFGQFNTIHDSQEKVR